VLVLILCVVHASIRRNGVALAEATMSASDVIAALRLARQIEEAQRDAGLGAKTPEPAREEPAREAPAHDSDENVTPLVPARLGKKD
jgi:hypothetical protein